MVEDAPEDLHAERERVGVLPLAAQGAQDGLAAAERVLQRQHPDGDEGGSGQLPADAAIAPEEDLGPARRELLGLGEDGRGALARRRFWRERMQLVRHRTDESHRLGQPHVDLGLGESLFDRGHDRRPELHVDLGVLLGEARDLPLLVADRSGQHVVRDAGRLGHGRIDHDQEIELLSRPAERVRVRVRQDGVRPFDDERP